MESKLDIFRKKILTPAHKVIASPGTSMDIMEFKYALGEIFKELAPETIIEEPKCGNTTRQVDEAIQTLFRKGFVAWRDHRAPGNLAMMHGFALLKRRLWLEHGIKNGLKADIDDYKYTIKLTK
jgi:hypothetical protein